MRAFLIGSDSDFVEVTADRRFHPQATDWADGNWLDAAVVVKIGPWRAAYPAELRAEEFRSFRRQLEAMHETLQGSAEFEPMEPWLELTLSYLSLGHIRFSGIAGPATPGRVFGEIALRWEVDDVVDQSSLPALIQQLLEFEPHFPPVGYKD